ncbi:MAG: methyltetrahydrofolate cobalamin methyltransferase [Clostridiales Family XIII bacterium]|jgi:5-methyltetrahydrofolate--homocysteine methyltransferase|nr:methyltetrahydrofolate cobalamin methyltransferase [Clostridiales Family XIII bacterium]
MIIIGEKINGFIPSTLKAIEERDEAYLKELAVKQTETGASFIDVCAGTAPEVEKETLAWLMDLVQGVVDTPLSVDSSDVDLIIEMLPKANKPGLINSVSGEGEKCDKLFPVIADTEWQVVALTCDKNGIPTDAETRFTIATSIIEKAKGFGIATNRIYIDPLVTTLATTGEALTVFNDAVRLIKDKYPDVHVTSGLSNISFGMPFRRAINTQFLALAMAAGMDSAIMDPTSEEMRATLFATDALLENDKGCRRYLKAFRNGLIGGKK